MTFVSFAAQSQCFVPLLNVLRIVSLGKYGSFQVNQILGRPFHLTFEILDRADVDRRELRVVPAAELHADALIDQSDTTTDGATLRDGLNGNDVEEDSHDTRTNRNIIDDPSNQKLTMAEIEALKQDHTGSSKEIISKILQSHSTVDQKTAFSLAKYTLRKHKKYMRRFCVLPLDVPTLANWMMNERDFAKIMEVRNEILGLIGCSAHIHSAGSGLEDTEPRLPSARYLVVDDTGGLLIAAMAERIGILYPSADANQSLRETGLDIVLPHDMELPLSPNKTRKPRPEQLAMSATTNTLTLLHANAQPNLTLLKYFGFDSNTPSPSHALYAHLKTLSWLQLREPNADPAYAEPPEIISDDVLRTWKSSKRSTYYRKKRRWERTKSVVDETRAGGFDGLVVASFTNPVSILHSTVPLLAGGTQVVVYSPHIEPLVELADLYSTARRTAYINTPVEKRRVPSEDFPLDPTSLLGPMVQTARVRRWQVLPGRTHPLMMGKGGAEGYVFVATRVLRVDGKVEARGRVNKRRKVDRSDDGEAQLENMGLRGTSGHKDLEYDVPDHEADNMRLHTTTSAAVIQC